MENSKEFESLFERLRKEWGYYPVITEVYDLYTQGELTLSDAEEDALLDKYESLFGSR